VRQLCDATITELLKKLFSVGSVPRHYKQDKSGVWLVVRETPDSKDVNTEVEGSTALVDVTRQRLAKTQQTEKSCCVMN
jgi:hypothetical protein